MLLLRVCVCACPAAQSNAAAVKCHSRLANKNNIGAKLRIKCPLVSLSIKLSNASYITPRIFHKQQKTK